MQDFEPIAPTFVSPQYLITRRGLAPNSMRELVDLARREPGKLNYASIGPGSSVHLAAELLKIVAGIDMTHVPYSGSGPAVRDTIAGHVDLTFTAGGMTYADQAKVLGVTSAKRTVGCAAGAGDRRDRAGLRGDGLVRLLAPAGTRRRPWTGWRGHEQGGQDQARCASGSRPPPPRSSFDRYARGSSAPTSRRKSALARRDQGRQYPARVRAGIVRGKSVRSIAIIGAGIGGLAAAAALRRRGIAVDDLRAGGQVRARSAPASSKARTP